MVTIVFALVPLRSAMMPILIVMGSSRILDEDGDGFTICEDDCDDLQPLAWPGKQEVCDGLDNDCDGGMDNIDQDGDGYTLCTTGGDCDDRNANAHPVLVDINAENDGDGSVETPFRDLDEAIANVDNVCH